MTRTTAARHSCDNPDWYTPEPIVLAARVLMGGIDLDPASDVIANQVIRAKTIFTVEDDGLHQAWRGRVFLNPPGGKVKTFWQRLMEHYSRGFVSQAVWIGYSLEQLQTLQQAAPLWHPMRYPICVTAKRLAFVENEAKRAERMAKLQQDNEARLALGAKPKRISDKADSPSHSNYITYLGPRVKAFLEIFEEFGACKP